MKKIVFILAVFVLASSFASAQVYNVDNKKSTLNWLAKKVTGQHEGTVSIKSGQLVFDKSILKSGTFVINMQSIVCTDIKDADTNAKLIGHLRSEDFFSVTANPEASLVITQVKVVDKTTYQIKAKLTIKGITDMVDFPATLSISNGKVTAVANIVVDRTKYNVRYGSAKFFDSLGDKAISDVFEIMVKLEASK